LKHLLTAAYLAQFRHLASREPIDVKYIYGPQVGLEDKAT
jgi:hypothetical protein